MASTSGRDAVVAEARRWLAAGCDVLLVGERGIGKSSALEELRTAFSRSGLTGVLLRASGPAPFAAVLDHPSAPARAQDENALTAWLADELVGRGSALLVDDVDRLDAGSARVVHRVLVRTGCRLVATTTQDLLRAAPGAGRDLIAARAPAGVQMSPLDPAGLAALVADTLDGPADAALTAALLAQSGGNPGIATALLAAARATGLLRSEGGRYVADGGLLDVPAEAVATLLLGRLDGPRVEALTRLALVGPVPSGVAARLVDPDVLDDLADAGRVVAHASGAAEPHVVVSPPALARALRGRVSPPHQQRVLADARAAAGDALDLDRPRAGLSTLLVLDAAADADLTRLGGQVAAVVHERAVADEATARAQWLGDRRYGTAAAYLVQLLRRPAEDEIAAVFREAVRSPADTPEDVVLFVFYRSRWESRHGGAGGDPAEAASDGVDGVDLRPLLALEDLKQRLVTAMRDGEPPEEVAAARPDAVPTEVFRGAPGLLRAAALLEVGRPDLALGVLDGVTAGPGVAGEMVQHYRAALRGQCLLLLGRVGEAERHQRGRLGAAYDQFDAFGIRVHAAVLAEVLTAAGDADGAWRVLSAALRLGPAGPLETTYYRRGLALGALLQARAGHVDLARALLRELAKTPKVYRPMVRSLRVSGAVALAVADDDRDAGTEIAWRAGLFYAEAGLRQPALATWLLAPAPLGPDRAAVVRATREGTRLPLLDPYLDLLLAVSERDEPAAEEALRRVDPAAARSLLGLADEVLGGGGAADDALPPTAARSAPVSAREREVLALAREGLGNREIAEQLHLSVRTVENHMSRALRKLGYRTRVELRRAASV